MVKSRQSSRAIAPVSGLPATRGRARKVSLTVDENTLSAMEREAKKAKRTLSAEVTEALARELRRRRLHELVTEYENGKGAITAKELVAIKAEWLG